MVLILVVDSSFNKSSKKTRKVGISVGDGFPKALIQWQSAQDGTELQLPAPLSFSMSCFNFKQRV